jgi:hypothetical protein
MIMTTWGPPTAFAAAPGGGEALPQAAMTADAIKPIAARRIAGRLGVPLMQQQVLPRIAALRRPSAAV